MVEGGTGFESSFSPKPFNMSLLQFPNVTELEMEGMHWPSSYITVPVIVICGLIVFVTKAAIIFYTIKHSMKRAMNWLIMNDQVNIA